LLPEGSLRYHSPSIRLLPGMFASGLLRGISSSIVIREHIIKENISTCNHIREHILTQNIMGELYIYNPITSNRISKHAGEHISTLGSHQGAQSHIGIA